jgi:phage antirepressor YoqD-like protein
MDNDMSVYGDKRMTVKEVADILGYEYDTIRKKIKELFPENVEQGKSTLLTEVQVVELKKRLVPRTAALKSGVDSASTELEMKQKTVEVMAWLMGQVEQEKAARMEAERKHAILMHVSKTYTATEIAKELNLKSAQELNRLLVDRKIQYKQNNTWVLYSDYSDLGYTEIKQKVLDTGRIVYDRHFTQDGRAFLLGLFSKELV